jgi:UDP-N-acetylglucosamine pyrophosphorylase
MGVGRALSSTAVCGVAEETGVGTGPLAELQAENINNPNKPYNRSINFLIISSHRLSIQFFESQMYPKYKNIIAPNLK